jgi:hypothetical protein
MNQDTNKTIRLKADLSLSCDFPTKKANFHHLVTALQKRGYNVVEEINDLEDSRGENEIYVEHGGNSYKVFTSIDPKAKDAIIDSNLDLRITDVVSRIENIISK